MRRLVSFSLIGFLLLGLGCSAQTKPNTITSSESATTIEPIRLSDAEWKEKLDPLAYHVLREAGTERPFTSPLLNEKRAGTFVCAGCDLPLFDTKTKYKSGTGWPSFWQPIAEGHVLDRRDLSHGWIRTENVCARCDGHLGHVFEDGPRPTGLRYCMNGAALKFVPAQN